MPDQNRLSEPIRVVLNPSSGSGAGARLRPRLEAGLRRRGVPFHLCLTEGPGHARSLAASVPGDPATPLLAVGGDGTVHEVANGLMAENRGRPLAVLPVGTGNDFHRMVGSDGSVDGAVDLLIAGTERRFDLGRVRWEGDERFFVNLVGIGIDTEVLRNRARYRRLRGVAQYLAAVVAAAWRYRSAVLSVEPEARPAVSDRTILTTVTVGPTIGGGFRVSPDAEPDDGLLDLLFVQALSFGQVIRYLPRVMRGTHQNLPVVHMETVRRVRLSSPDGAPFAFELDGELMDAVVSALDVEVVPGALSVLVPAGSPA